MQLMMVTDTASEAVKETDRQKDWRELRNERWREILMRERLKT